MEHDNVIMVTDARASLTFLHEAGVGRETQFQNVVFAGGFKITLFQILISEDF